MAVARNDLQTVAKATASKLLYNGTLGAGAVIITFSTIAVVSQLAMVVLRLLNKCNSNINIFLTMLSQNIQYMIVLLPMSGNVLHDFRHFICYAWQRTGKSFQPGQDKLEIGY